MRAAILMLVGLSCSSKAPPRVIRAVTALPDRTLLVQWASDGGWLGRIDQEGQLLWTAPTNDGLVPQSWKSNGITLHGRRVISARVARDEEMKSTLAVEAFDLDTGARIWQRFLLNTVAEPFTVPDGEVVWNLAPDVGFDVRTGAARSGFQVRGKQYELMNGSRTIIQTSDGVVIVEGERSRQRLVDVRASCVVSGDLLFVRFRGESHELTRWPAGNSDAATTTTLGVAPQLYIDGCIGFGGRVALLGFDGGVVNPVLIFIDEGGRVERSLLFGRHSQLQPRVYANSSTRFVPLVADQTLFVVDLERRTVLWSRPIGDVGVFRVGSRWYVDESADVHRLMVLDGVSGKAVAVSLGGAGRVTAGAVTEDRVWLFASEPTQDIELSALNAKTLDPVSSSASIVISPEPVP